MELQQLSLDNKHDNVGMSGKQNEFKAGRLKDFVSEWQKLTSDRNILNIIAHCEIEFKDNILPIQKPNSVRNLTINMGAIEEVSPVKGQFISSIFVRPKKSGEYRVILNLKNLNEFVEYHHFKMDTFNTALELIKPNMYMASIDLRHAYHSISMHENFRKYLRFIWDDKIFQYSCLPFGLTSAPRIFTKIMKVVFSALRKNGHVNIGYLIG